MIQKLFVTAFLVLCLTSCATQEFRMSEKAGQPTPSYKRSQPFFVYGVGQTKEVKSSDVCKGDHKVVEVTNRLAPLDAFLGLVQWVYTPRSTSVTCK